MNIIDVVIGVNTILSQPISLPEGVPMGCTLLALDMNGDGVIDVTDTVAIISTVFEGK